MLLVVARTGDARLAGLLVAAFTVPTLVAGPVLGAWLDRLRRKRPLFAVSQAVLALDLAAVLVLAGRGPGWLTALLALLAGATSPVLTGGYSTLVPLVIAPSALGRANALDAASYGVAGIAGPAAVSAVAGTLGAPAGFAVLVGLSALGLPLLLAAPMRALVAQPPVTQPPVTQPPVTQPPVTQPPVTEPTAAESLGAAIADGLRLLRRSRELAAVTAATTTGQFFQGPLPVLLPLLAVALGRPASGGGWLLTAFSAGGLLGALASARLLRRWRPGAVLAGSLGALAVLLVLLAVTPSFPASLAAAAAAGVADGPALAATLTVRQGSVPASRYAQVLATAASFKIAAYAAGSAAAGLLTGLLTVRELLLAVAAGQLLAAVPLLPSGARGPRSGRSRRRWRWRAGGRSD